MSALIIATMIVSFEFIAIPVTRNTCPYYLEDYKELLFSTKRPSSSTVGRDRGARLQVDRLLYLGLLPPQAGKAKRSSDYHLPRISILYSKGLPSQRWAGILLLK